MYYQKKVPFDEFYIDNSQNINYKKNYTSKYKRKFSSKYAVYMVSELPKSEFVNRTSFLFFTY